MALKLQGQSQLYVTLRILAGEDAKPIDWDKVEADLKAGQVAQEQSDAADRLRLATKFGEKVMRLIRGKEGI